LFAPPAVRLFSRFFIRLKFSVTGSRVSQIFAPFLHHFCNNLIRHSQIHSHTTGVISRFRFKFDSAFVRGSTSLVETRFRSFLPAPFAVRQAPEVHAEVGPYRLRMAEGRADREAACRLRFEVFNLELGEGLESSFATGLDTDRFDRVCDHLLVEEKGRDRVVGTYRMQSGPTAAKHFGYYSGQEFHLAPYEPLRPGILELGRAAIHRDHRTPEVLTLLWRGIAQYAHTLKLRYLLGCSSLNSCNPAEGWRVYRQLEGYRVQPEFETAPTAAYLCPEPESPAGKDGAEAGEAHAPAQGPTQGKVPKLLKTYLAIGARIAAPPAWDREFRTIDFLTLLDLESLTASARNRFLAPLTP
jgi:putative hemolysin